MGIGCDIMFTNLTIQCQWQWPTGQLLDLALYQDEHGAVNIKLCLDL